MRDPDSDSAAGEWLVVEDPEQARLLTDLDAARYFEPFIARERSVSEAARELGCRVDTLLYRVRQFLAAGLLEVTRLEKRAGRAIKQYRSVADAFFVPFAATPYANLEELIYRQMEPFNQLAARSAAELLRQSGRDGRRIFRKPNGEVWNDSASDASNPFRLGEEGVPAAYDFRVELQLEPKVALELQRELHELFERYNVQQSERGRRYLWENILLPAVH